MGWGWRRRPGQGPGGAVLPHPHPPPGLRSLAPAPTRCPPSGPPTGHPCSPEKSEVAERPQGAPCGQPLSPGGAKSLPQAAGRRRGHALLIDGARQLGWGREDPYRLDDEGLHQLVDTALQSHRVLPSRDGQQRRPKAHGQVVGVHHVLVAVLGQAEDTGRSQARSSWLGIPTPPTWLPLSSPLPPRSTHWLRKVKRYRKTTSTGPGSRDRRPATCSTRSATASSSANKAITPGRSHEPGQGGH